MKIACAFDHAGFPLRDVVFAAVEESGNEAIDLGVHSEEPVDYPDVARKVGRAVASGIAERGVLVCGSGAGVSIAAAKIQGVYAATIHDEYSAHQAVEHDGMNVLCLGSRVVGSELAREIVLRFLAAEVSDDERHVRRREKLLQIEQEN
jgi:ribose 5-phosphate isomerase B